MRHDEISQELRDLAFDFFYWFSRFEFALKEAPCLEDDKVDARAMPGWEKFIVDWQDRYTLTPAGQKLIDTNRSGRSSARMASTSPKFDSTTNLATL